MWLAEWVNEVFSATDTLLFRISFPTRNFHHIIILPFVSCRRYCTRWIAQRAENKGRMIHWIAWFEVTFCTGNIYDATRLTFFHRFKRGIFKQSWPSQNGQCQIKLLLGVLDSKKETSRRWGYIWHFCFSSHWFDVTS